MQMRCRFSSGSKREKKQTPISTGPPSVDKLLGGGLRSGELVCMASPQEAMNTQFLLQTAKLAKAQMEQTVLIIASGKSFDWFSALWGDKEEAYYLIYEEDYTVKDLWKELMHDDSIGIVIIGDFGWTKTPCDNKNNVQEECSFVDKCDLNKFPHPCVVKELKELAESFDVPIVVTQKVPDTNDNSLVALGISPDFDHTLFLRCDDQIWQFRMVDKNESLVPSLPVEGEQKSPPDLLRFIPSKDVREHLKEIGWQPPTLQAARLVLGNETVPLNERLETLLQITETLPDVLLDLSSFVDNGDSLHTFLSAYVQNKKEKLAEFYRSDNAMYVAENYVNTNFFTSAEACLDSALIGTTPSEMLSERVLVNKYVPIEGRVFGVLFNGYRQPMRITGAANQKEEEIEEDLLGGPFTLPHPFRRFDLVWQPGETDDWFACGKPILLDRLPEPMTATPDSSLITAGYCCRCNGSLDYKFSLPIKELEYLPKENSASEAEILLQLRDYLSGTIPLCSFANSFAAFSMRTAADWVEGDDYKSDEPTAPVPPVDDAFLFCDDDLPI